MNFLNILFVFFLFAVGVATISIAYKLYRKLNFRYLKYYLLCILFNNAFTFIEIISRYLAKGLLSEQAIPENFYLTVNFIFNFLAGPFGIIGFFFFINYIRGLMEQKNISSPLAIVYFLFFTITLLIFGNITREFYLSKSDLLSIESKIYLYVFSIISEFIYLIVVFQIFYYTRYLADKEKRKGVKILGGIYVSFNLLQFILFKGIFLHNDAVMYYLFPIFTYAGDLIPLLYLKNFLNKYYRNHPIHPKNERDLAAFFTEYNVSEREQEIIHLILKGKSNKEIEDELFISIRTVKTHIYNIYKKLSVKSRWQLINLVRNFPSS